MLTQTSYLAQMQSEMLRLLPTASRREKDAFAALGVDEQAWRFMNWLSRLVHPHPRQVAIAQGFDESPTVQANRRDVDVLLTKINNGGDLKAYLSEEVEEGYCLHRPGKKHGHDFDMLLNEWGIHHLHLSSEPGRRDFNKRTNDLLYVIFGFNVAFVLAVAPHDSWTSGRLISIAIKSWPQQNIFIPIPDMLPGRDWTEDEHKGLRKAGVTTVTVVDGRWWLSSITGGITTALVSTRISKETSRVLRCLNQAERYPEHLERQLMKSAAVNGIALPAYPRVNVRCFSGSDRYCFGFFEEASGTILPI
jgi:hypothetical protein